VGAGRRVLEIEVVEVRGRCPVHKVGDKIVVAGPKIVLEETDALCTHALSSLLHYIVAFWMRGRILPSWV
jgi:uncharacterized repeat protein (TIGR04076 family)